MLDKHNVDAFRANYRAQISPIYRGGWHALAVGVIGLTALCLWSLQLDGLRGSDWLMVPLGMVLANFSEYATHRWLGHHKRRWARLFYQRHTGDHHSFFSDRKLAFETSKDWRVVLFPVYLVIAHIFTFSLPLGLLAGLLLGANAGYLLAISLLAMYLLYEVLHFSYHLPAPHWVHRAPLLRHLLHLHRLHHRRALMTERNFNLTFPLFDLLLGTYYWEPIQSG
ncbi:hypothetical protein FKG94_12915 [Exilibacterium tricleocarpae]|uniref:Fatty acid hydroxylase domain-containing protein n=1 Tax=Exilibacterium tricleocarpae TaxID=2591008 RepID=A0A545TP13_9GAMM|nr:sterol desaturase family protein [Exilibacterium tricleocarpae]TQV78911.1 hypothetical protein FKG94_12915 [Exilibacterium tricleocarpae]